MRAQKVLGAAQLVDMVRREEHIPWRWGKVGILAGVHTNDELKCQNTLPLWKGKSVFFLITHPKKPFCTKFKKHLLIFVYDSLETVMRTVVRMFFEPTNLTGKCNVF